MKELKKVYDDSPAGQEAYWSKCLAEFRWGTNRGGRREKKKVLRKIRDQEDKWAKEVEELELGHGYGVAGGKSGKHVGGALRCYTRTGKRGRGAGAKNRWLEQWKAVRQWHWRERCAGHHVDKADIFLQLVDEVQATVELLLKQELEKLSGEQREWLEFTKGRLERIVEDDHDRDAYVTRLMAWMGAKNLAPQRYTELTEEEEALRAELTWQLFDYSLQLAAFGSEEELKGIVADPKKWIEERRRVVLVMSDQIPFWVGLGHRKTVYAAFERESSKRHRRNRSREFQETPGGVQTAQGAEGQVPVEEVAKDAEGQTQKRGLNAGKEKLRVTFENRNAIFNYFDEDQEPVGVVLPSILLLIGAHARLSNISDDHRWIKHEEFYEGGELRVHLAGKKTECLKSYVELRKEKPELFKDLVVMAAPAGFMTEVTQVWSIEDIEDRVGPSLHQRDMLASALAKVARKAMQLCQSIATWIAGQMTPALQLTDTDAAFPLKSFAKKVKQEILTEQKHAAEAAGMQPVYNCGAEEILRIAGVSHQGLKERQASREWVVAGMARDGHLAYRPSLSKGELVNPWQEEQSWTKGLKVGSHRLKEGWLKDRWGWLDGESGKPIKPDFSRSSAKRLEAMEHAGYMPVGYTEDHTVKLGGLEFEVPVVNLDGFETTELATMEQIDSWKHPKVRRREEALRKISPDTLKKRLESKKSYWRRLENDKDSELIQALEDEGWHAYMAIELEMNGGDRRELLAKLQPRYTGKRGTRTAKAKAKAAAKEHQYISIVRGGVH